ncbi:argininosuccinate lyase [Aerococcus sp. 1KP-2016]|uniref:argininosuccinate lyase n=1 Tax=Aerococcus sp. 1KP-2016 TaxID=1981982 RepID=UPI000B997101|nr:argininosuccinate lyase [Aerococcus sp. 1KP-2016]OYQ65441.1 argininosuccinate lyase [Aerococcus sp. 1KP-2016]
MAIWSNKFHEEMSQDAYNFNQSIQVDYRLLDADLRGSKAHAAMLGKQGILPLEETDRLVNELEQMRQDYANGSLQIDFTSEDVHSFIEAELTERLGTIGKKVHTGRSRNDQVATAMRIYVLDELSDFIHQTKTAIQAIINKAEAHLDTIMPGYTHLQRAQPITYAHYLMAYAQMHVRDLGRFEDLYDRVAADMPLGAGALATSSYPIDPFYTTSQLEGFTSPFVNSIDAVSNNDYAIEFLSALSIMSMHMSRYAEETIMWSSQEFRFIRLTDAFSTGSSIMPQKKNADIHELMRGKTGRVYGDLMAVLTIMKGIPLAYDKDMQEIKEQLFDGIDHVKAMLSLLPGMLEATIVDADRMYAACGSGFLNATDCADYLTNKGMAFRDAYKISGNLVAYCTEKNQALEDLTLEEYQGFSDLFEADIYEAIDLKNCVYRRNVAGGPAPEAVQAAIERVRANIA